MADGVDTTAEAAAVLARLNELAETCYEGVPQGEDMGRNEWGEKPGYRDVSFGSILPTARVGRMMGTGEENQAHAWTIEVSHTAATKAEVRQMATATDKQLIGWAPTANSTSMKPYYYVQYENRSTAGAILSYTGVRFYECVIGVQA